MGVGGVEILEQGAEQYAYSLGVVTLRIDVYLEARAVRFKAVRPGAMQFGELTSWTFARLGAARR